MKILNIEVNKKTEENNNYIGVRDCPYGICCPWVRGGWGLDALEKFFRRRRRRRRPRPLLFRQFLGKISIFSHFFMKN